MTLHCALAEILCLQVQRNNHSHKNLTASKSVAAEFGCGKFITRLEGNMDIFSVDITSLGLWFACAVALFAGLVKGSIGFAMPTILISGMSLYLAPDIALAALILPTLVSNGMQALRQGLVAAWESICEFWVFLVIGGACLLGTAQLVTMLAPDVLYLFIGTVVTLFAIVQLIGWQPSFERSGFTDGVVGAMAGGVGGLSGIWGPQTVTYLTAVGMPKISQVRAQGVIFGLGSVALLVAHVRSGVVNAQTLPLSLLLVVPAAIGTRIGFVMQDRIDQATFKRATLIVLCIGGLNLIRRGVMG